MYGILYISEAFDMVWHKGLLFKLKQNGINVKLLLWTFVQVTTAGVPQVSVYDHFYF